MRVDFDFVDIEGPFDMSVVMNCSSELIRCYGKISVLHLTCERFAQGLVETLGTVDVPLIAGHKERSEEWDALDMIPMRMWPRKPLAPPDISFWPNECPPVPQSTTTSVSLADRTSMHEVFPP